MKAWDAGLAGALADETEALLEQDVKVLIIGAVGFIGSHLVD